MKLYVFCKYAIIVTLALGASTMGWTSNDKIIKSVKAMEHEFGLTVAPPFGNLSLRPLPNGQSPDTFVSCGSLAISPDGNALAWCVRLFPYRSEKTPFLTLKTLREGEQPVWVEGRVAGGNIGISFDAEIIVATSIPLEPLPNSQKELLAIDRRSGIVVHNLTPFITQFNLRSGVKSGNNLEDISVSGSGNLVALSTSEQMLVLEIPNGKTVYAGSGSFPRLSPDGKRLAFVNDDKLMIHSFADGSTVQLLKGKRVKGIGSWSPDGRFLLAGAWTTVLALEKRKIVIDTTTGDYAVIGKLGEGDYGNNLAWVSTKLLNQ
jgi:hypothetical protein